MTTDVLNRRSQRGLDLAKSKHQLFRRLDEDTWIVPSATCSHHDYLVDASRLTCTCPDAEESGVICKHLWGVAYLLNEITLIDGTRLTPPRVEAEDAVTSIGVQGGAS
ncbi:MAG: SWIM zinc finger family protein [Gemmatimonadaceae bacterium]|nr:SWIM zinc finger family protein [Gemmatimonadaceae bacterium]